RIERLAGEELGDLEDLVDDRREVLDRRQIEVQMERVRGDLGEVEQRDLAVADLVATRIDSTSHVEEARERMERRDVCLECLEDLVNRLEDRLELVKDRL